MRLDKHLASVGTRSEVKKILKTGVITVNGETVKKGDFQVKENDIVLCNGEPVIYKEFIYLLLNKPAGYVSAVWDKKYPVVVDLIPDEYKRYEPYPVGRLDIDTEGLLIITNDGELTHNLTSPKKDLDKKYFTVTDIPLEERDKALFSSGMDLGDFVAKPATLELTENPLEAYITISEGKFHQVKRMCEKCGKKVTYLKRVSIGCLELDNNHEIGDIIEYSKDELLDKIYAIK